MYSHFSAHSPSLEVSSAYVLFSSPNLLQAHGVGAPAHTVPLMGTSESFDNELSAGSPTCWLMKPRRVKPECPILICSDYEKLLSIPNRTWHCPAIPKVPPPGTHPCSGYA